MRRAYVEVTGKGGYREGRLPGREVTGEGGYREARLPIGECGIAMYAGLSFFSII